MFLAAAKRTPVNLEEWAVQMMEKHNRKSHLAPQLSPSTQALLRGQTTASPKDGSSSAISQTPTSGEIPFIDQDLRETPTSEMGSLNINGTGTGMHASQPPPFERQFPPRSSSSTPQTTSSSSSRPRETDTYPSQSNIYGNYGSSRDATYPPTTNLPLRPVPPPTGPLPQPPTTAFRSPNAPAAATQKRPTTNTSAFPYSDPSHY